MEKETKGETSGKTPFGEIQANLITVLHQHLMNLVNNLLAVVDVVLLLYLY